MARTLAFIVVLLLAFVVQMGNAQSILIIDNNTQLARVYNQPCDEHGMTAGAFKAYVFHLIAKYNIKVKRIRWVMRSTMLQREEIGLAVLYGAKSPYRHL